MNENEINRIKFNITHTKKRIKMLENTRRKNDPELWYLRGRLAALDDMLKEKLPFIKKFNKTKKK